MRRMYTSLGAHRDILLDAICYKEPLRGVMHCTHSPTSTVTQAIVRSNIVRLIAALDKVTEDIDSIHVVPKTSPRTTSLRAMERRS
jgi:hypothetical protein